MAESHPQQSGHIVIAGGSGFIGRRLAAVLGGAGYRVVILSRSAARAPVGPVHFAQWQGQPATPDEDWPALLEGARAVINLCGESIGGPRWTARRKAVLIESRVRPSEALVTAINGAANPPPVMLQSSGVGYYGTGEGPFTESSPPGNDFLAELARRWEAPLAALRPETRGVVARLGVVLGKNGGALGQMLLPFRLFMGGPIASGQQWLSWIHLHDAAEILKQLAERPECQGPYNVVAPNPVRNAEFAELAARALKRPAVMFTPRFLLKALLGEQSTLVCDGQQVRSERLPFATFRYPDLAMALADLV